MKSSKELLLIISVAMLSLAAIKTDSTSHTIKENIFDAIHSIDYTSINVLLSDGADINSVDRYGNTPLMAAAKVGNPRIVNIILAHNPKLDIQNKSGQTALMIASQAGQLHIVKELLSRGAKCSQLDKEGNTVLTLASKFGHAKIVSYLQECQSLRAFSK